MSYMSNRSKKSEFPHFKNYIFSSLFPRSARETVTKGEKKKKKQQRIMHNSESEVLALANWTATGISPVAYSEFPQVKEDGLLKMTP